MAESFSSLTLADLRLGLAELLDKRGPALGLMAGAPVYLPLLRQKRDGIEALPVVFVDGQPFAEELATAGAAFDPYGRAIHYYVESAIQSPAVPEAIKEELRRVRRSFIPDLAFLLRSYADQAAATIDMRKAAAGMADVLRSYPVPAAPGEPRTLHDWVMAYLGYGDLLGQLLQQRAVTNTVQEGRSRKDAALLRSTAIGLLGRLRSAVQDELDANPELPRDLDGRLFGFLDELARMRAQKLAGTQSPAPSAPEEATPATPTSTTGA